MARTRLRGDLREHARLHHHGLEIRRAHPGDGYDRARGSALRHGSQGLRSPLGHGRRRRVERVGARAPMPSIAILEGVAANRFAKCWATCDCMHASFAFEHHLPHRCPHVVRRSFRLRSTSPQGRVQRDRSSSPNGATGVCHSCGTSERPARTVGGHTSDSEGIRALSIAPHPRSLEAWGMGSTVPGSEYVLSLSSSGGWRVDRLLGGDRQKSARPLAMSFLPPRRTGFKRKIICC